MKSTLGLTWAVFGSVLTHPMRVAAFLGYASRSLSLRGLETSAARHLLQRLPSSLPSLLCTCVPRLADMVTVHGGAHAGCPASVLRDPPGHSPAAGTPHRTASPQLQSRSGAVCWAAAQPLSRREPRSVPPLSRCRAFLRGLHVAPMRFCILMFGINLPETPLHCVLHFLYPVAFALVQTGPSQEYSSSE